MLASQGSARSLGTQSSSNDILAPSGSTSYLGSLRSGLVSASAQQLVQPGGRGVRPEPIASSSTLTSASSISSLHRLVAAPLSPATRPPLASPASMHSLPPLPGRSPRTDAGAFIAAAGRISGPAPASSGGATGGDGLVYGPEPLSAGHSPHSQRSMLSAHSAGSAGSLAASLGASLASAGSAGSLARAGAPGAAAASAAAAASRRDAALAALGADTATLSAVLAADDDADDGDAGNSDLSATSAAADAAASAAFAAVADLLPPAPASEPPASDAPAVSVPGSSLPENDAAAAAAVSALLFGPRALGVPRREDLLDLAALNAAASATDSAAIAVPDAPAPEPGPAEAALDAALAAALGLASPAGARGALSVGGGTLSWRGGHGSGGSGGVPGGAGGGGGAVSRARHDAVVRSLCDRYTRAVTAAMQRTLASQLSGAAAAEAAPVVAARQAVRGALRHYHANEAGIADACAKLREADVVMAYLKEENAGLRRARDAHRARLQATAEASAAAAEAVAAEAAAGRLGGHSRTASTGSGYGGYGDGDGDGGADTTEGDGGDGSAPVLSLASNPLDALGARASRRTSATTGGGAASGSASSGGANAALRAEAVQLKAALARRVKQHKERRLLVAQRRQQLSELRLALATAKVEARAQLRTALESLADQARDVQGAREGARRAVAAARARERDLRARRAALADQLQDMTALEQRLRGLERGKQAEVRELTARRLRLRQEAARSLRATEDAFIAACRERADRVDEVLGVFSRLNAVLRRSVACAVCGEPMAESCVVVETGEGCCRACVPRYTKRDALARLRDERQAMGALGIELYAGPPPEEPWVELYLKQDPPASWPGHGAAENADEADFVPFVPEVQPDPVTGEFQTRFKLYDEQLQDMMMHCQLTPVILRSFLAQRTRKDPSQQSQPSP